MPFEKLCPACSGTGLGGTCGECQGNGRLQYGEGQASHAHWAIVLERIRSKTEQIEARLNVFASLDFSVLSPAAVTSIRRAFANLTTQYELTKSQPPGQTKDEFLTDLLNHFDGLLNELRRNVALFPQLPVQAEAPAAVPRKPTPRLKLSPVRKKVRLAPRKKKKTRDRPMPEPAGKELAASKPRRNPRIDMSQVSVLTKRASRLPPENATELDQKRRRAASLQGTRGGSVSNGARGNAKPDRGSKRPRSGNPADPPSINPAMRDELLRATRVSQLEERNLDGSKDWHAWRETGSGQFGSYPSFDADPD